MPNLKAMASLHPSYLMRDQEKAPLLVHDLSKSLTVPPENYNLQPSLQDVQRFAEKYRTFAFDIETNRWTNEVLMVGLCARATEAMVVPFKGAYWTELKKLFARAENVIGHNCVQFDLPILHENGVTIGEGVEVWDTMLMQHLCFPAFPHDLEFTGSLFCSKPAWKDDKESFETYCARDTDVTYQCWTQLLPMVKQHKMLDLYKYTQVPLGKICKLMGDTGIKVDTSQIEVVRTRIQGEMVKLEEGLPERLKTHKVAKQRRVVAPEGTLSAKTGKPVKYIMEPVEEEVTPWRSQTQIEKYLYTDLALPVQTHLKTERVTTGKDALERLYRKTKDQSIKSIQQLRKLDELMTTFCKEQMLKIDRMYPHFLVHGTKSGRLSSADPNLQNIPEAARVIYVPSHEGWKLLEVDYSGIENKLTAYFAHDQRRLERFILDPKFSEHKHAVEVFFGIPYDEVEKDNDKDAPYGKAKRIVHGCNYGMGAQKISKMYDMDLKEVQRLLTLWKTEILDTTRWQAQCAEQAKRTGFLRTVFGRMRWFYTAAYYTEALSFLPQSSAADVIFRAMIGLMYERIKWPEELARKVCQVVEPLPQPARLLLQVHDALLFECPGNLVDQVIATVKKVMEQPWPELGGMGFSATFKVGDNWWECA